jgi:hypothetical protein
MKLLVIASFLLSSLLSLYSMERVPFLEKENGLMYEKRDWEFWFMLRGNRLTQENKKSYKLIPFFLFNR